MTSQQRRNPFGPRGQLGDRQSHSPGPGLMHSPRGLYAGHGSATDSDSGGGANIRMTIQILAGKLLEL